MKEEKRDLYHLYEKLESIMIVAEQNQNNAREAIEVINTESSKLKQMSNEIKILFRQELEKSMLSITSKGATNVITKFREADQYSERAVQCYKSIIFWTPIKFIAAATFIGTVILTGATIIIFKVVPTVSEIERRIESMKQIELLISKNKVQLSTCDGRRCVKVNRDELEKTISEKRYYGDDSEAYIILDGY
jgi:hypothetical protein